jgi:hypothetical protein
MKIAMLSPDSTSITEESGRSHTNPIVGEGVMLKSVSTGFSVSASLHPKIETEAKKTRTMLKRIG